MITRWDFKAKFLQEVVVHRYFHRKKANDFRPPAEAKDMIREDGVHIITEVPYAYRRFSENKGEERC